jgi:hypothetical protein
VQKVESRKESYYDKNKEQASSQQHSYGRVTEGIVMAREKKMRFPTREAQRK